MTVKELIKRLKKCDPKAVVVMSSDPEGNSYRELGEADGEDNFWGRESREIGIITLTKDLVSMGYTEEDLVHGPAAVVLWPEG
jgi:hypothetical protein